MHFLPLVDTGNWLSFILFSAFLITEAQNSNLWWDSPPPGKCALFKNLSAWVQSPEPTSRWARSVHTVTLWQTSPVAHIPVIGNKQIVKIQPALQTPLRQSQSCVSAVCPGFSHSTESCSVCIRHCGSLFTILQVREPEIWPLKLQSLLSLYGSEMYRFSWQIIVTGSQ